VAVKVREFLMYRDPEGDPLKLPVPR